MALTHNRGIPIKCYYLDGAESNSQGPGREMDCADCGRDEVSILLLELTFSPTPVRLSWRVPSRQTYIVLVLVVLVVLVLGLR